MRNPSLQAVHDDLERAKDNTKNGVQDCAENSRRCLRLPRFTSLPSPPPFHPASLTPQVALAFDDVWKGTAESTTSTVELSGLGLSVKTRSNASHWPSQSH